jgi:hypothetical protein
MTAAVDARGADVTPIARATLVAPVSAPDAEVQGVAAAIAEVCRRVVAAEEGLELEPADPPVLPRLDPELPLAALARRAGLDPAATAVLRLLVAAELDRHAHRFMRRLAEDPTQAGIEVDAVVTAAAGVGVPAARALDALAHDGALLGYGLVEWTSRTGPLWTRRVTVAYGVLRLARGLPPAASDDLPSQREVPVPIAQVALGDADAVVDGVPQQRYARIIADAASGRPPWLVGPPSVGKRTLVASLAALVDREVLCVDYRQIAARALDDVIPRLWRESLLHDAILVIHDAEAQPEAGRLPAPLYGAVARAGMPAVFVSTEPPRLADFEPAPFVMTLAMPPPERRASLWQIALGIAGDTELAEISWQLPLAPGRIVRAAEAARELASFRAGELRPSDVRAAVSQQVAQKVASLGTRVRDAQTWDDVVLPAETMDGVRELVARVHLRKQVLEDWGFHRKLAKGVGLAALFLGPPGTGKTMVAGIIAAELGLELYQIDLSRVTSKWIGETEKNLGAIFDAAEGANVMLLFDECDTLFAKRSEVKSSNDKYANAEVNYLLQRIERFEGVSILTTNLDTSIDPAFKRRLAFRIQFPVPDAKEREVLWRRMLPAEADVAELDFPALAKDYELAGGNIRNAVLRAAYLAAAERSAITHAHLERSIVLEYRDAGKLATGGRIT